MPIIFSKHVNYAHYFLSGIKAGMFVRDAKAHCPQLVIVHYDFEAYEEVIMSTVTSDL